MDWASSLPTKSSAAALALDVSAEKVSRWDADMSLFLFTPTPEELAAVPSGSAGALAAGDPPALVVWPSSLVLWARTSLSFGRVALSGAPAEPCFNR